MVTNRPTGKWSRSRELHSAPPLHQRGPTLSSDDRQMERDAGKRSGSSSLENSRASINTCPALNSLCHRAKIRTKITIWHLGAHFLNLVRCAVHPHLAQFSGLRQKVASTLAMALVKIRAIKNTVLLFAVRASSLYGWHTGHGAL